MSEPVSAVQQYPAGWYPDPATPGRDRWWDGTASTRFTAKTVDPSRAGFGLPYVHSMRVGANRLLVVGRVLVAATFIILMFLILTIGVVIERGGSRLEYAAVTVVGVTVCLSTIAVGIIGLRRSPRLGGKGVAIWTIACGSVCALLMAVPVLFAIFYRP